MKKLLLIFSLFTIGCSVQKNKEQVISFENTLGQTNTEILNLLVKDFENNLEKLYPNTKIKDGYKKFLLDIRNVKIEDSSKYKFQTKTTNTLFHESGFWNEIYEYSSSKDLFTNDPTKSLEINNLGKYMTAMYQIKDSDSIINKYWRIREAAGFLQNEIFVDGLLSMNPDFDNYFHKRIVVIEFSF